MPSVSLNPYSNGMMIEHGKIEANEVEELRLNPYSNGMMIEHHLVEHPEAMNVLILILME